jgi:hypothetical protein
MRTKAEALAKPLAGDKWLIDDGQLNLLTVHANGRLIVSDGRFTFRMFTRAFRKWAGRAKFIGGAE